MQFTAVPYMRLASARQFVRSYQKAVARCADLSRLRGDAKRAETERLRALVLDRLALWGGSERDAETFLPLIGSPLATAWQRLGESYADGLMPMRCAHEPCGRAFTLAETDKRLDAPPRHCSARCRLAAWRARGKKSKGKKKAPRRGRGRKKT